MIPNSNSSNNEATTLMNENDQFMCGVVEGFYGRPWTTEQRKLLFRRMNKIGMNSYLYAPKDDSKHRMYWRDLYSVEEADHLTSLIEAAKVKDVQFIYALSPGLDLTYSSTKELTSLKRKLEQVASFGCSCFALLFDDIEVDMCETDKEIFQSFAHAQVSVTNEVYQHLGQPAFLFCPTEYCATRAIPSVSKSEYLKTIGSKLLPDINIMWTGPKVVSKKITINSLKEVSDVMQRPPVIWDNLHANDYDQRRLFLGPYDGRSPEIIPYIRGVLTNPNCEFEANYIAMHTLAQWSKSQDHSVKRDVYIDNPVSSDIQLETEGEYNGVDDEVSYLNTLYQPYQALDYALADWLKEFQQIAHPTTDIKPLLEPLLPPIVNTCIALTPTIMTVSSSTQPKNLNELALNESYIQPQMNLTPINSLVGPCVSSTDSDTDSSFHSQEPMDCAITPSSTPITSHIENIPSSLSTTSKLTSPALETLESTITQDDEKLKTAEVMQVDNDVGMVMQPSVLLDDDDSSISSPKSDSHIPTLEDLRLLVDLFYLPFEHGKHAEQLLDTFHWLKANCFVLSDFNGPQEYKEPTATIEDWRDRAKAFQQDVGHICSTLDRLSQIPNQSLLYDLYPYIQDMKTILSLLAIFTGWLGQGRVPYVSVCYMMSNPYTWANSWYKENFQSGRKEPWVFRGGLQADFQRLLPVDTVSDLLMPVITPVPSAYQLCTIRPYTAADKTFAYEICRKTCDDGNDSTDIFPNHADLPGDRYIGAFLTHGTEYSFVVEESGVFYGYALAALKSREFFQNQGSIWLPTMKEKYPKLNKTEDLSPAEELISTFYTDVQPVPEQVELRYPSKLNVSLLSTCKERGVERRVVVAAVTALKANGSAGVHVEVSVGDKNTIEFYNKLGFFPVPPEEQSEDRVILGRVL